MFIVFLLVIWADSEWLPRTCVSSGQSSENRATSAERVTVTQGDSILTGTGLRADLQAKRFQLLNDVKGRYAPRSP